MKNTKKLKYLFHFFFAQYIAIMFPKLYKKNNNKIYEWTISLDIQENVININTIYGYVGGSLQTKTKTLENGKGGRSLLEQATLEAKSKWTDKKEKELYSENAEVPLTLKVRPMLAQTFNIEKKCHFPVYVQRKYDGIRCVAHLEDCSVILESRNGVPFSNFDVLREQLLPILQKNPTLYLDGELYTNEIPFETLSGYVRLKKNLAPSDLAEIDKIQYHIYDFYSVDNPKEIYQNRLNVLSEIFQNIPTDSLIKEVKTDIANNHTDIQQFHADYVANGYEGIMIRSSNGIYELDKRSKYLHKYKEFMEDEFEIVGFHQGDAGEKGCVVWDCINDESKTFAVRPRGTFEQRKEWFLEGDSYIGKKITVIFQEYSQDGIPRFPVGKSIRIDF
jgi:DNA ligase-1